MGTSDKFTDKFEFHINTPILCKERVKRNQSQDSIHLQVSTLLVCLAL